MDWFVGTTYLDWLMAVLGLFAFIFTVGGLAWSIKVATAAKDAATAAQKAVTTTRAHLMGSEMASRFRLVRELISHAERAIEDENVPVSKHVLIQLADSLNRASALAESAETRAVPRNVIDNLKLGARLCSSMKDTLARSKAPKTQLAAKSLSPVLVTLSAELVRFETIEQFSTPEVS